MEQDQKQAHYTLLLRYKILINTMRPDIFPRKALNSNYLSHLELRHILWMIEKMQHKDFIPLTTNSAWISWIQAGLYYNGLIVPEFEKDITRDVLKQYP